PGAARGTRSPSCTLAAAGNSSLTRLDRMRSRRAPATPTRRTGVSDHAVHWPARSRNAAEPRVLMSGTPERSHRTALGASASAFSTDWQYSPASAGERNPSVETMRHPSRSTVRTTTSPPPATRTRDGASSGRSAAEVGNLLDDVQEPGERENPPDRSRRADHQAGPADRCVLAGPPQDADHTAVEERALAQVDEQAVG